MVEIEGKGVDYERYALNRLFESMVRKGVSEGTNSAIRSETLNFLRLFSPVDEYIKPETVPLPPSVTEIDISNPHIRDRTAYFPH